MPTLTQCTGLKRRLRRLACVCKMDETEVSASCSDRIEDVRPEQTCHHEATLPIDACKPVSAIKEEDSRVDNHQLAFISTSQGDFMVVEAENSQPFSSSNDAILEQGQQTITLSLEDATRFLLQQHGLTRALQVANGTLQIVEQPALEACKETVSLEGQTLHIEVLQAMQAELDQQLPSLQYTLEEEGMDTGQDIPQPLPASSSPQADPLSVSDPLPAADPVPASDPLPMSDSIPASDPLPVSDPLPASIQDLDSIPVTKIKTELDGGLPSCSKESSGVNVGQTHLADPSSHNVHTWDTSLSAPSKSTKSKQVKMTGKSPGHGESQADMSRPIPLSEQTIITVKGKKCMLAYDQDSGQVCAYPLKPPTGSKRRGRPRMTEEERAVAAERKRQQQQQTGADIKPDGEQSTAAETLLELSNVGSDGLRRSGRKRKKAKLFEEYEELKDSEDESESTFEDNQERDPDISLNIPEAKKKKSFVVKKEPGQPTISRILLAPGPPPVKRGRGRPRRYFPPQGQLPAPTSIPAVMIPSSNGQTIVMTPIQNVQTFRRQLPNLIPKSVSTNGGSSLSSATSVPTAETSELSEANTVALGPETDSLPLDSSEALDNNSIIPTALQTDTVASEGEQAEAPESGEMLDTSASTLLSFITPTDPPGSEPVKDSQATSESEETTQTTLLHIPDNLLTTLGFKKDPVKIGLKASERELEKLKCSKCDFQGYYLQQYRNHIATHQEDIHKCKCCSYVSLSSQELLQHFQEYHPRCICPECDYMAEHAYIIKRHMMRHDTKSCTCHICGKVYKDTYILKMHIKMVHMPAEVLFECTLCSKKFTRKAHLKRHLRIHEPEKPYKCPVCDYRGCERSDISKHMLIHEEPKHTCERCGKTFRHIKNKELHVKRHYGQRDYKCGVCDFFGYTFTDIRKHIERKHQDIKTLICDKCNKPCRNEFALKEHQRTCTENMMLIEQVLAIPTSAGGTSQATIQIPSHLSHDGQIIVDGHAISVDGSAISVDGSAISVDGSSINMDGSSINVDGSSINVDGSSINVDGSAISVEGSAINVDGSVINVEGSSISVDGSAISVDGSVVNVDGSAISLQNNGQVNIMMAGDQQLSMSEGVSDMDPEDQEHISDNIMEHSGQEMHIMAQEALTETHHVQLNHTGQMLAAPGHIHIISHNGEIIQPSTGQHVTSTCQLQESHPSAIGEEAENKAETACNMEEEEEIVRIEIQSEETEASDEQKEKDF